MRGGRGKRTAASETFQAALAEAQSTRLFVLQETGPSKMIVEDESKEQYKVEIGNTTKCSCGLAVHEPCTHIVQSFLSRRSTSC
jgi:hypothetical protein